MWGEKISQKKRKMAGSREEPTAIKKTPKKVKNARK